MNTVKSISFPKLWRNHRLFPVFLIWAYWCSTYLYGDGCFVWRKGADLYEPSQKAVIYHKDGREKLILQVKYEGSAEDFAWIVPLPSQPQVEVVPIEDNPFAELSLYTQQRRRWGYRGRGDKKPNEQEESVTVLERKIVGVYDVSVLDANDAKALNQWLNKNGYSFPADRNDVLKHYTERSWKYVAMRIDRKALGTDKIQGLKTGQLQPICFSFITETAVYPLRISSLNAGQTEILLYVLSNVPLVLKHYAYTWDNDSIQSNFPAQYQNAYRDPDYGTFRKTNGSELPMTWDGLKLPSETELFLCKYRGVFTSQQMWDDVFFILLESSQYWRGQLNQAEFQKAKALYQLTFFDKESLLKLTKIEGYYRSWAARHPKTPPEILTEFAKDGNSSVRQAVANNSNTPETVLNQLSGDPEAQVRMAVASNLNTPPEILRKLSHDEVDYVKQAVAGNPNTPKDILCEWANHNEYIIRASVAANPGTPDKILRQLTREQNSSIRGHVAQNPNIPVDLLINLARDESSSVRAGVAFHPRTPMAILLQLAKKNDMTVNYALARNPNTPLELRRKLQKEIYKEMYNGKTYD